jgi:hypothetical protein
LEAETGATGEGALGAFDVSVFGARGCSERIVLPLLVGEEMGVVSAIMTDDAGVRRKRCSAIQWDADISAAVEVD